MAIQIVPAPATVSVPATTGSTVLVPRSKRVYLSITNLSETATLFLGFETDGVLNSGEVLSPLSKQIYEGVHFSGIEIRGYATEAIDVAYQAI